MGSSYGTGARQPSLEHPGAVRATDTDCSESTQSSLPMLMGSTKSNKSNKSEQGSVHGADGKVGANAADVDVEKTLLGNWDTNFGSYSISRKVAGGLLLEVCGVGPKSLSGDLKRDGESYAAVIEHGEGNMLFSFRLRPMCGGIYSLFRSDEDEPWMSAHAKRVKGTCCI